MQNLSDFLKRFSKLKNPKDDRKLVAEIISKTLCFEVLPDEISIKNRVVRINKLGKIKTEIFIRKEILLQDINKHPANLNIQKII
jgi:hypothetical protein